MIALRLAAALSFLLVPFVAVTWLLGWSWAWKVGLVAVLSGVSIFLGLRLLSGATFR